MCELFLIWLRHFPSLDQLESKRFPYAIIIVICRVWISLMRILRSYAFTELVALFLYLRSPLNSCCSSVWMIFFCWIVPFEGTEILVFALCFHFVHTYCQSFFALCVQDISGMWLIIFLPFAFYPALYLFLGSVFGYDRFRGDFVIYGVP